MGNYYDTFLERIHDCTIPSLEELVQSEQQFINEEDTNVLSEELIHCVRPFIDKLSDKDVPWWGLLMCSLFKAYHAGVALGVIEKNQALAKENAQ